MDSPLRHIRKARHLTLDELARRAGSERTRLSRAERGYISLQEEELRRIAAVLRVRVRDIRQADDRRLPAQRVKEDQDHRPQAALKNEAMKRPRSRRA